MPIFHASNWEPEPRREPEPRTEPEARTEPAPRTEPDARTEPIINKILSIRCPFCGYHLVFSKGPEKQKVTCTNCGNVFQVE